ncbi:MAG: hypothetical protein EA350_06960 [Gemmatimonadales bacterium]|nr:MAG: hypothetical protein EA350_06960 [Gemmatimonadales bacterium]
MSRLTPRSPGRVHRRAARPGRTCGLLPPFALACLVAAVLVRPAGEGVAQAPEDEPSLEFHCERLALQFQMDGWKIHGTCEYRMCRVLDEDGYIWKFGGVPVTYVESDCGPLGTHPL